MQTVLNLVVSYNNDSMWPYIRESEASVKSKPQRVKSTLHDPTGDQELQNLLKYLPKFVFI